VLRSRLDVYPFILLNLAFSLQAAFAAHRRDPSPGHAGL